MNVVALHLLLAYLSLAGVVAVGLEGAVRAARNRAPGGAASRLSMVAPVLVFVTMAGGLGMVVGGARPHEWLHVMYAVLAFGCIPIAGTLASKAGPRAQGLATLAGALVVLMVIARLFGTG